MRIRCAFIFLLMLLLFAVPASADFVLPADLTEIGEEAFANDESITGVLEIPEGVTSIGAGAFQGCGGITGLVLPESLVEIGENAFAECDGLEGVVTIHQDIELDDSSFAGNNRMALLRYAVKEDGTAKIVSGWMGAEHVDLAIPGVIDGYHVTEIAESAFANNVSILGVLDIPEGVKTIGADAFHGCNGITEISLPESIGVIGENAFAECTDLTGLVWIHKDIALDYSVFRNATKLSVVRYEVTAEENVKIVVGGWIRAVHSVLAIPESIYGKPIVEIGDHAFSNAPVTEVTMPDSVVRIGYMAFEHCQQLVSVSLSENLAVISPCAFFYCSALESISLPSSVETIGESAFERCTLLSEITIVEGLVNIGGYAFAHTNISSIDLPDSATNINWDGLFLGCTQLTQLELPNNIETITWELFNNGEGSEYITELILPESVVAIEESALNRYFYFVNKLTVSKNMVEIGGFRGMNRLETVIIPEDSLATAVADWAFAECFNLKNISLPQTVTQIGDFAFSQCHSLSDIALPEKLKTIGLRAFSYCDSFVSIKLPNSVISIGGEAFAACSFLQEISLPNSLKTIGGGAFSTCPNLTSISIPDSVTSIEASTFRDCGKLKTVKLPEGLTSIGISAFWRCSSLSDIAIPDQVAEIGSSAFYQCTSLINISLPKSLTILEASVFSECTSLTSIVIPDSVTTIYERAFRGCTSLTEINMPKGLQQISVGAFEGCSSLGSQISLLDTISVHATAFDNTHVILYRFHLNTQQEVTLTTVNNYSTYPISSISIPSHVQGYPVTGIGDSVFEEQTSLVTAVLPDGLESVGDNAFKGCFQLAYAPIPESVTSIGSYAFYGCTNLPGNLLPPELITLGEYAFHSCYNITSLTIPSTLSEIPAYAFAGCSGLTQIHFPESVLKIGSCAFTGCTGLTGKFVLYGASSFPSDAFSNCSDQLAVTSQLREDAYAYVLSRMQGAYEPQYLMGNIYNDERSAFHHVVCAAVDAVNLNLDNIWTNDNKTMYLFLAAVEASSGSTKIQFIDPKKSDQLENALDVWSNNPIEKSTFSILSDLCDVPISPAINPREIEDLYDKYKLYGFDGAVEDLIECGASESVAGSIANSFTVLRDFELISDVTSGVGDALNAWDNITELFNQLRFLETLDKDKLKMTANVYCASDDAVVRAVGEKLYRLAESSREDRIRMIKNDYFLEFGIPEIVDILIDIGLDKFGNVFTATVQFTNSIINALTGLDEMPRLVNEMRFAAEAATSVYGVLQDKLAAFESNPNDATFKDAYWTFLVYCDNAALSQTAFIEFEEHMDDQIVIDIGDELREVVEFAKTQKTQMAEMVERTIAFYGVYEKGDVDGLVKLLREQGWIQ